MHKNLVWRHTDIWLKPFGQIIDKLRERISFLGTPAIRQKQHNNTIVYRFESEEGIPSKLKIEVNCREHFSVYGIRQSELVVESEWFKGKALLPSYHITELLGTKLRALYQRRKGRDLFDLYHAITKTNAEPSKVIDAWRRYMKEEGNTVSQKEFVENMEKKMTDKEFLGDIKGLLRPDIKYDTEIAYSFIKTELLEKL